MLRAGLGQILQQEAGEAEDDANDVVEIMGDASRKLADRLHLARLEQLLLEHHRLRHVMRVDDDPVDARNVEGVARGPGDMTPGAALAAHPRSASREPIRSARDFLEGRRHRRGVLGMHALEYPRAEDFRILVSQQGGRPPGAAIAQRSVGPVDGDDVHRVLDQRAMALLALAQRRFGFLALADVAHHHQHRHEIAGVVEARPADASLPASSAVGAQHTDIQRESAALGDGGVARLVVPRLVGGMDEGERLLEAEPFAALDAAQLEHRIRPVNLFCRKIDQDIAGLAQALRFDEQLADLT